MSEGLITVLCTVPDRDCGEKIAEILVSDGSAACVSIVPGLLSIYRWKGKINRDNELLLLIKTKMSNFSGVKDKILDNHPYEVPEIVYFDISGGHHDYIEWIRESVN